jgi:predicted dehydrogenase
MVRIGLVGIGFMGMTHFEAATKSESDGSTGKRKPVVSKLNGGEVVAIATRDPKKLAGDWTSIQGNFGPRGSEMDLSGIKRYSDYKQLLADPAIDLVDVCLPTDQHESVVLQALAAGKHVLVEKPIATELSAANRMVNAAKDAGRQLLVGQVLPFFPEFAFAAETVRSGRYGKLLAAHFRRVIAQPDWSSGMSDFRKLGGWGVDLHIHDNHYIGLLCGVPKQVFSRGLLQEGLVNHVHTSYLFENRELAVTCVSGGIAAKGLAFGHGFEMYLEQATIVYDAGTYAGEWVVNRPLTLITNDGRAEQPSLPGGAEWCSAFTAELQAAVDSIRTGREAAELSGTLALQALRLCEAERQSMANGQVVSVA